MDKYSTMAWGMASQTRWRRSAGYRRTPGQRSPSGQRCRVRTAGRWFSSACTRPPSWCCRRTAWTGTTARCRCAAFPRRTASQWTRPCSRCPTCWRKSRWESANGWVRRFFFHSLSSNWFDNFQNFQRLQQNERIFELNDWQKNRHPFATLNSHAIRLKWFFYLFLTRLLLGGELLFTLMFSGVFLFKVHVCRYLCVLFSTYSG